MNFDINTPQQLENLPFRVSTSIANHGGSTGMLRTPEIFLKKSKDLEDKPISVGISLIATKPSNGEQDSYLTEDLTTAIPAQAAKTLLLDCTLNLLAWDNRPPLSQFKSGLTLKEVWIKHFEDRKKETLALLSIIDQTNSIGIVNGEFVVTEKSNPVFGSITWKKRELFSGLKLEPDKKGSASLREKVSNWQLDSNVPLNLYRKLFKYVEDQGDTIKKTLEELSSSPSKTVFPIDDSDEKIYAANTLGTIYPDFGKEWQRLSSHRELYEQILLWLEGQTNARELSEKERELINDLSHSLADTLSLVKTLRNDVIREFADAESG